MRNLFLAAGILLLSAAGRAQGTTGYSGTGANIDVKAYRIWWRIAPDSSLGIKGSVNVSFQTMVDNITSISFDLRNVFTLDKVTWHGNTITPVWSGNTFSMPVNITDSGTWDSVTIVYHGPPPTPSGQAAGFTLSSDTHAGNYVNTLSESYEDRDWWPCKADMQDKADTIDMSVSVPWRSNNATYNNATDTFWVASNGTLIDSTIDVANRSRTFKYINRYPMASYLVCLGVARYDRYYRGTVPIGGFNVPVVYYLLAGKSAGTTGSALAAMDKATLMLPILSQRYGNYGFIDPARGGKHGFYEGLTSAEGMEHQTFSAIATGSIADPDVLIHELQHQWFGDKVSFSTWQDLWLAEGFAAYSPILARQTLTGFASTAAAYRASVQSSALAERAPTRIPLSGIASSNTIWTGGTSTVGYGSTVYDRGAMVVSMLRTLAGDTKFFNIMTAYQTRPTLQYKSANMDTLRKIFSDTLGVDLTAFFNDNVVGTGYPTNTVGYQYFGTGGKSVALSMAGQSLTNAGAASYIHQPIVVHLKGPAVGNDTTIVFYDWGGGNLSKAGNGVSAAIPGNTLTYNLSFAPNFIKYDDSAQTTSTGSMTALAIVNLKIRNFAAQKKTGYNHATLVLEDNPVHPDVLLERSADGVHFSVEGNMLLQAGTAGQYALDDHAPLQGNNYYRAKFKAGDAYQYSAIVKLTNTSGIAMSLETNPVKDALRIQTGGASGEDIRFDVFDLAGRLLSSTEQKNSAHEVILPLSTMARGIYVLRATPENGESESLKFQVD